MGAIVLLPTLGAPSGLLGAFPAASYLASELLFLRFLYLFGSFRRYRIFQDHVLKFLCCMTCVFLLSFLRYGGFALQTVLRRCSNKSRLRQVLSALKLQSLGGKKNDDVVLLVDTLLLVNVSHD